MKTALSILNSHLLTHTYLVGERITLADIIVACNLLNPYKYVLDPDYRKPFGNVNRWFNTLINQPEFKAVLGEVELCSKPAQAGGAVSQGKISFWAKVIPSLNFQIKMHHFFDNFGLSESCLKTFLYFFKLIEKRLSYKICPCVLYCFEHVYYIVVLKLK